MVKTKTIISCRYMERYEQSSFQDFIEEFDAVPVVLDGGSIRTRVQYFEFIEKAFSFPRSCQGDLNIYYQIVSDLSWFGHRSCLVVIEKPDLFLIDDIEFRDKLLFDARYNNFFLFIDHPIDNGLEVLLPSDRLFRICLIYPKAKVVNNEEKIETIGDWICYFLWLIFYSWRD